MPVAISTDGKYVSPHFERCPSFTLVDIENGKTVRRFEIENPGHSPGYIPQFLHEKDVKGIVSGGMGARAQGFFVELGIETIMGVDGSIDEVIEKLEKGVLEGGQSLCTPGAGKGYGVEKTECDHAHE
ncbi:MAG: dinitrogenase iron-molybdenum cofactor [Desulfitibacter sp. BRH_c19]|nr:MAG: dinitrogenase iron-molybdenum cofactor [Desulfitibacter sp. BRH_c19]